MPQIRAKKMQRLAKSSDYIISIFANKIFFSATFINLKWMAFVCDATNKKIIFLIREKQKIRNCAITEKVI